MKVFITGLGGFLAANFATWLTRCGHVVAGTSRSGDSPFHAIPWRLGEPIDSAALSSVDVLIHAAHDFTPGAMSTNVEGTLELERAAAAAGVKRQLLVSSLSARPDAVSEYGRTKLAEEEPFLRRGHTVIRPGTVLGRGGLFGKMAGMLETFPVLPLLDGGKVPVPVVGIHDLCRGLVVILQRPEAAQYNLYYRDMPTLGELLRLLARILDRQVVLVPVPAAFLLLPLSLLRRLGIRTPVDVDNLKGYMTASAPYHSSNLARVLERPSSPEAALREAWGAPTTSEQPRA